MHKKQFISWSFDPAISSERTLIITDMLYFIREGLQEPIGPRQRNVHFEQVEAQVKAAMFEKLNSPMAKPLTKKQYQPAGDTVEMVVDLLVSNKKRLDSSAFIAGFRCGNITSQLVSHPNINILWSPTIDEESTSVLTAWEMTYSNLVRANTRLVLMHTLLSLLQMPSPPTGWEEARKELWVRRTAFQRDLLVFSALQGADHLKAALHLIAPTMCYAPEGETQYSVIPFVSVDGRSPGHWLTVTEKGLADDIRRKYEAL